MVQQTDPQDQEGLPAQPDHLEDLPETLVPQATQVEREYLVLETQVLLEHLDKWEHLDRRVHRDIPGLQVLSEQQEIEEKQERLDCQEDH